MSIEFHCDHCGHMVRTASENAGKRGKCPHCHQSVYIPMPPDEIEPLGLAPVDTNAERERQRADEEARRVAQALRGERAEIPPEAPKPAMPEPVGDLRLQVDVETLVTEYVLAMADGQLDEAERLAADIRQDMSRASEFIQRLTMDEMLPRKLSRLPRALIVGFVKQLSK
jgi:hypothetical protein